MAGFLSSVASVVDPTLLARFIAQWAVKGTLMCVIALLFVVLAQRGRAAVRHAILTAGMASVLLLPALHGFIPAWELPSARGILPPLREQVMSRAPVSTSAAFARNDQQHATSHAGSIGASDRGARVGVRALSPTPVWVVIWAVGVVGVLAWLAIGYGGLDRMSRRAPNVDGASWDRALASAAGALGVRRPIQLRTSSEISAPCVAGLLRPTILLPVDSRTWPVEKRYAVLLHELAHVRRHDRATQILAQVACAVLWFNPAAWYASWRIRIEREHACDDAVLATGVSPVAYADYLLETARGFRFSRTQAATAVAMARYGNLESRLLAILDGPNVSSSHPQRRGRALVSLTLCLALPLAAIQPPAAQSDYAVSSAGAEGTFQRSALRPTVAPSEHLRAVATRGRHPTAPASEVDTDSVYVRVAPQDGGTELILTARDVRYLFTARGMRKVDSTLHATPAGAAREFDAVSHESALAGVANMRILFPLRDVAGVEFEGRALTLIMDSSRVRGDGRAGRGKFRVEAVRPEEAESFVRAFAKLKMQR